MNLFEPNNINILSLIKNKVFYFYIIIKNENNDNEVLSEENLSFQDKIKILIEINKNIGDRFFSKNPIINYPPNNIYNLRDQFGSRVYMNFLHFFWWYIKENSTLRCLWNYNKFIDGYSFNDNNNNNSNNSKQKNKFYNRLCLQLFNKDNKKNNKNDTDFWKSTIDI